MLDSALPDELREIVAVHPSLPAPVGYDPLFASQADMGFGWNARNFYIVRDRALTGRKVMASFPRTDEGLEAAWQTLVQGYPVLASEVAHEATRVAHEATTADQREQLLRRASFGVLTCTLLGGHGWEDGGVEAGATCVLYFCERELVVRTGRGELARSSYSSAVALDFTGPGRQTTGGRIYGGGFGLIGAAEGMIVAAVLNSLARKTTIHTVIRFQTPDMGLFFFYSEKTPEELRIQLSGVVKQVEAAGQPEPAVHLSDPVEQVAKLAALHSAGALSDEEFAALKAKLIASL